MNEGIDTARHIICFKAARYNATSAMYKLKDTLQLAAFPFLAGLR